MSNSQFVRSQTITPSELARSPVGTQGYFFLASVKDLTPAQVAAKVSSRLKSECSRVGSRCVLTSGHMFITGQSLFDQPDFVSVIVATISLAAKPPQATTPIELHLAPGERVIYQTPNKPGVEYEGTYLGDTTRKRVIIETVNGNKTIPRIFVKPK